ncbi:MAG: alpha/beta fold hydrolase [Erythrobacter sp.]
MGAESGPTTRTVRVGGIALTYYEWRAKPGNHEPPLVIAHATGFHGRCYGAIAEHFPDRRVIALDLRGHGRSEGGPIDHWRVMVEDVAGFLEQLRIRRAVGVGHSMGAHTLLQCAADKPEYFSRLVLFDPVILAPEYYAAGGEARTSDAPHPAIRRKRDFASPEAMMERFTMREPYSLFEARVFEDYCRHGLKQRPDGGYELACSPEMEASVYGSSRSNSGILKSAASVEMPVCVVRARQTDLTDFKGSPTWPDLASVLSNGTDIYRPDRTHFHPFEDSADAARIIAEAIVS